MLIRETARSAFRSLAANRLRTALTALGMIIGVASVVAVLAIGEGASASVQARIRALGSNLLMIRPGSAAQHGVHSGTVQTLTRADAVAIGKLPGVASVAPEGSAGAQVKYLANNSSTAVIGVTDDYLETRVMPVAMGLGFSSDDDRDHNRVAVLGAELARTLFEGQPAVGKRIHVRGIAFRVIGVLEEKGQGFGSPDDNVLVPLSVFQGVLFGTDYVSDITVKLENEGDTDPVQSEVTSLLRTRHQLRSDVDDDFEIRSQAEMQQTMSAITGTLTALLGSVAAVSLLVGGIGIMNIMLVSVRERTRENRRPHGRGRSPQRRAPAVPVRGGGRLGRRRPRGPDARLRDRGRHRAHRRLVHHRPALRGGALPRRVHRHRRRLRRGPRPPRLTHGPGRGPPPGVRPAPRASLSCRRTRPGSAAWACPSGRPGT